MMLMIEVNLVYTGFDDIMRVAIVKRTPTSNLGIGSVGTLCKQFRFIKFFTQQLTRA